MNYKLIGMFIGFVTHILLQIELFCIFIYYSIYKIIRRKIAQPNYQGQLVWITGASSGIGQFLAYQFNKHGSQLIISAKNKTELQRVKKACSFHQKVKVVKLDMTNFQQVQKVTQKIIDQLQKKNKKLDVVIQNTGVSMRCQFKDYPFQSHLAMFNVNVNGPYKHIQCFLPHMIKNKSGQIVGISSTDGKLARAYSSSQSGSKHALIGIFDSLRTQMVPFGIKVCTILPEYVKTNIFKNALAADADKSFGKDDSNIEKGMEGDEFAKEAVKAIFRGENEAQISPSWMISIGIQLRNLCPDLVFFLMSKIAKIKVNLQNKQINNDKEGQNGND